MRSSERPSAYFERIWEAVGEVRPERFAPRLEFLLAAVQPHSRVLDLGCGLGDFTAALATHGASPVGVDVADGPLRRARARHPQLEFVLAGERLPFGDGEFDVVWAGEVLEHVQDGLGLLAEASRVLAPGGTLLATTPDHGLLRRLELVSRRRFEQHFEPRSDHVRFFTAGSLSRLLAAADFERPGIHSRHGVLFATATRPRP